MTPELEAWIASRPPHVARVIRRWPPNTCYRMRGNAGHYWVVSYGELKDKTVTMKLAHGRDSYLPGVAVFGIKPGALRRCGCGGWQPPLESQRRFSERRIEAMRERLHGGKR